jgi:hypothetical protein
MPINVSINTTADQDERLERIRLLMNDQSATNYVDVDAMAQGALLTQLKGWEQMADSEEVERVSAAFVEGTRAQRDAVLSFMNKAPSVILSGDTAVGVGEQADLSAQVTDDGLPDGVLTYAWTMQSGPGNATFPDGFGSTDVSFDQAGSYVMRVTVDDGDKSDFAEITVVVS